MKFTLTLALALFSVVGCRAQPVPTPVLPAPLPSLPSPSPSPVLDFSVLTAGAHHVTQGHFMFFMAAGHILSGVDENATPVVTGLPSGSTVSFPNLVKFCCDKFLWTISTANPIRVDTASSTPPGVYTLTITYTSKSGVMRSTTHPLIVDPTPAPLPMLPFPPDVPLTGLAQWQSNMTTYASTHCSPLELVGWEGFSWYYDGGRVYWQIADYTKDPKWNSCAIAIADFYSQLVMTHGGNLPGYEVFPKGLAMSFQRTANPVYKTALLTLLSTGPYINFDDSYKSSKIDYAIDWSSSREISYGLETHLAAELLGNPRQPSFAIVTELLFGHFDQWFLSKNALYVQPFMSGGLGAEALIEYWDSTHDPRVPPLLKLVADELRRVSWDPLTNSFMYYNQGGDPSSPYDPQCSNWPSDGTGHTCKGPSPDLNLLIAPLYGWVYQHTGDVKYRTWGDEIFNAGVSGAYLQGGKQFSQNFRWSGKYVEWRNAPIVTAPAPANRTLNLKCNTVSGSVVDLTCKIQ